MCVARCTCEANFVGFPSANLFTRQMGNITGSKFSKHFKLRIEFVIEFYRELTAWSRRRIMRAA